MAPYEPLPIEIEYLVLSLVGTHEPAVQIDKVLASLHEMGWKDYTRGLVALQFSKLTHEGYLEKSVDSAFRAGVTLTKEGRQRVRQGCIRLYAFSHFMLTKLANSD